MEFGVPKEVRDLEMRGGLAPGSVLGLTRTGHSVYVQADAGTGAGFSDEDYRDAGAATLEHRRRPWMFTVGQLHDSLCVKFGNRGFT